MFDVFLSFNSVDRPIVIRIAEALTARQLEPFVDSWSLIPGRQWQGGLLDALKGYKSIAICLGGHGLGAWQNQEMQIALSRQAREGNDFPVIPVLLPGFNFERTSLGSNSTPGSICAASISATSMRWSPRSADKSPSRRHG